MNMGNAVAQLVKALRYKPEGRGFNSRWCHWNFSVTQSFRPHYGPGVDSASNRNEYQEYFLGGKGGRCVGLTTLPPSWVVLKSGSLNLLEPSGPVQACNGIALPLPLSWTFCAPQKIDCKCCKSIITFLFSWPHSNELWSFSGDNSWIKNFFCHRYVEILTWRRGSLHNCKAVIVTRSWILLGCDWHCKTWQYYSAKFFVLCRNSKESSELWRYFWLMLYIFQHNQLFKRKILFFFPLSFRGTYFDSFVLHHTQYWHLCSMNSFASILASKHIPEWTWAEQEHMCITVNWRSVT